MTWLQQEVTESFFVNASQNESKNVSYFCINHTETCSVILLIEGISSTFMQACLAYAYFFSSSRSCFSNKSYMLLKNLAVADVLGSTAALLGADGMYGAGFKLSGIPLQIADWLYYVTWPFHLISVYVSVFLNLAISMERSFWCFNPVKHQLPGVSKVLFAVSILLWVCACAVPAARTGITTQLNVYCDIHCWMQTRNFSSDAFCASLIEKRKIADFVQYGIIFVVCVLTLIVYAVIAPILSKLVIRREICNMASCGIVFLQAGNVSTIPRKVVRLQNQITKTAVGLSLWYLVLICLLCLIYVDRSTMFPIYLIYPIGNCLIMSLTDRKLRSMLLSTLRIRRNRSVAPHCSAQQRNISVIYSTVQHHYNCLQNQMKLSKSLSDIKAAINGSLLLNRSKSLPNERL